MLQRDFSGFRGQRALVTGATAFVDRALERALSGAGADVTALSRGAIRAWTDQLHNLRTLRDDPADQGALIRAVKGQNIVFNLAYGIRAGCRENLK
jgi:nucleoside-diphosphate-sugar epimerase